MTANDRPSATEPAAPDRRTAQGAAQRQRLTLSLRTKSVINLVVLILAVVIVGVAGALGLNNLNFEVDNLYNFMLIPIHTIDGANRTLSEEQQSYKRLTSSTLSRQDLQVEVSLIQTADEQFKAVLNRYHSEWVTTLSEPFTQMLERNGQLDLQANEVTTLASVQTEFDSYLKQRDEAIPRILAGSASPAELQLLNEASDRVQTEMDRLVDVNLEFARVSFEDAVSSYHVSTAVMIATGVIVSLLGMGLLFILLRSIVRPLNALRRVADDITSGRTDTIAPVFTRDEIGLVATAFNTMTARLRDLIDSLETRVELRTAQLQASAEVGRAASSVLDTDQLLKQAVNLIAERFGLYYAAAFTLDAAGQWAMLREASGPGDTVWTLKQSGHKLEVGGQSMVSAAIVSRRPRIALDVGREAVRFAHPLLPATRSEIALPLIVGDRVLGALDVQSAQAAAFDDASATVLQAMADQIAVALNNAVQYQHEQLRAEQITHLLEAAIELTTLTTEDVLQERIVQLATTLLHAEGASLWLPTDRKEIELVRAAGAWPREMLGLRMQPGQGLTGRIFTGGLPDRVDDYVAWAGHVENLPGERLRAALGVPMIWQNTVRGVLLVANLNTAEVFSPDDENLAQLLATQAAAAIDNIHLREQQQRTLDELNGLNRRLIGEAWQTTALGETIAYEYRSRSSGSTGQSPSSGGTGQSPSSGGVEPAGLSLRLPIELRGQPIGVMALENDQRRELDDDELALIQSVIQQMSLALENQRLTDIAQHAAQREKQIAVAADKIHRANDLEAILRTAVAEISRITGVEDVGIQLGAGLDTGNGQVTTAMLAEPAPDHIVIEPA
jgi:GAF domain-containing protein/HAMP domain-containing protein